jgi:hypothetical protein
MELLSLSKKIFMENVFTRILDLEEGWVVKFVDGDFFKE